MEVDTKERAASITRGPAFHFSCMVSLVPIEPTEDNTCVFLLWGWVNGVAVYRSCLVGTPPRTGVLRRSRFTVSSMVLLLATLLVGFISEFEILPLVSMYSTTLRKETLSIVFFLFVKRLVCEWSLCPPVDND